MEGTMMLITTKAARAPGRKQHATVFLLHGERGKSSRWNIYTQDHDVYIKKKCIGAKQSQDVFFLSWHIYHASCQRKLIAIYLVFKEWGPHENCEKPQQLGSQSQYWQNLFRRECRVAALSSRFGEFFLLIYFLSIVALQADCRLIYHLLFHCLLLYPPIKIFGRVPQKNWHSPALMRPPQKNSKYR